MGKIGDVFRRSAAEGRAALLPFMTAGLPRPQESVALFAAMAEAGADGFEIGIPYSDPLMDGPVIQRASDAARAAGATFDVCLDLIGQVGRVTGRSVLAMTYANPVFRRGVDESCRQLVSEGADGVIVPDLPLEESGPLRAAATRHGLGLVLFVAPTSDQGRIEAVAAAEPVFIYAIAEMGVTGERASTGGKAVELIGRIRRVTQLPVVLGVGVSTPDQARAAADAGADGVIVGSALVRRVLGASDPAAGRAAVSRAVAEIRAALGR